MQICVVSQECSNSANYGSHFLNPNVKEGSRYSLGHGKARIPGHIPVTLLHAAFLPHARGFTEVQWNHEIGDHQIGQCTVWRNAVRQDCVHVSDLMFDNTVTVDLADKESTMALGCS